MRNLTRLDLHHILHGAAIFGAGGGGQLTTAVHLINQAFSKHKSFLLADLHEIPDDALVCTPYSLGAVSPSSSQQTTTHTPILAAYDRFQQYLGRSFYGTIACELGASNIAVAFYVAAMSGHCMIDADPAARAVPEVTHSTYYINGLPASPVVLASQLGETFICENVADDMRSEVIIRALASVCNNDIAAIDHALEMRYIRNAVIPGTISMARDMGRTWQQACSNRCDVSQAIATHANGAVVFRGVITDNDYKIENAFTVGNVTIEGTGQFSGSIYRIWLKNENLVGWRDGVVDLTIPDLICLIDVHTGKPVINPDYHTGMSVAVVGLPAPQPFTSSAGLQIFGPSYAGLDCPYVPVSRRTST